MTRGGDLPRRRGRPRYRLERVAERLAVVALADELGIVGGRGSSAGHRQVDLLLLQPPEQARGARSRARVEVAARASAGYGVQEDAELHRGEPGPVDLRAQRRLEPPSFATVREAHKHD